MKLSYQQLCFLLLYVPTINATTLYNNSDVSIKFNIFKKHWILYQPFPEYSGTLQPHTSKIFDNLDPEIDYIITFYDVHNAKHNQRNFITGNTKKVTFKTDQKKSIRKLQPFEQI